MSPVDRRAYEAALAAFYRQQALIGAGAGGLVLPAAWMATTAFRGGASGERIAMTVGAGAAAVSALDNYRRAEQRARDDVAKEAARQRAKLTVERAAPEDRAHVAKAAFAQPGVRPTRHEQITQLATLGVYTAGWLQSALDYRRRPGRRTETSGAWWRPRPGPVWWSGWSWQQLPINATSTAPRDEQIAHERRQVLTLEACTAVATAIAAWDAHLRLAIPERDWIRAGGALLRIIAGVARGVIRYRGVPSKVDTQRARRRSHQQALAAAEVEVAAGRRPPPNPWRREMTLAAAVTAIVVGYVVLLVTYIRRRPLARHFSRPAHEPALDRSPVTESDAGTPPENTDSPQS